MSTAITYRPLRLDDAERVVDILLASRALDGPAEPISRAQLRYGWFEFPGFDLERDSIAAAGPDGVVVGFAGSFPRDRPTSAGRVFIPGTVDPAHRRSGIGTHLLRTAEIRAREQLALMPPELPRQITCDAQPRAAGQVALFDAAGYLPVRRFETMHRDLATPLPTPPDPPGISFTPWRDELSEETRLAHNDAFQDHWGSDPQSPERWGHFVNAAPGFSAESSWLALDGGTVTGYSLSQLLGTEGQALGWLGTIGVRRGYRRRGIAAALVARSLASFRAAGLSSAGLDVDAENPSGAVRVYAGLGFKVTDTTVVYSKTITG